MSVMRPAFLAAFCTLSAHAQTMSLEDYRPRNTLVVQQHIVTRAKFPFIDVHNHQPANMQPARVDKLIKEMDALNMRVMVNLSGGFGDRFKANYAALKGRYPERFVLFCNLNFANIDDPDWTRKTVSQLEQDVRSGAQGLKIFKNLGMDVKDSRGQRVRIDDTRFDPVWEAAGRLKIPVIIHSGDPFQFWQPQDKYNERWLELKERPERIRPADKFPPWETIMSEQHRVFEKHPKTTFINAHLGWLGGNLAELGKLMDRCPNMYTEIGAVLAELGRQPRTARQWLIRYQGRVLFGKDTWEPSEYHTYFRVLETADEYFDYYRRRHAFWQMYGLDIPDEVLKRLYYMNALKVIPGLNPKAFVQ